MPQPGEALQRVGTSLQAVFLVLAQNQRPVFLLAGLVHAALLGAHFAVQHHLGFHGQLARHLGFGAAQHKRTDFLLQGPRLAGVLKLINRAGELLQKMLTAAQQAGASKRELPVQIEGVVLQGRAGKYHAVARLQHAHGFVALRVGVLNGLAFVEEHVVEAVFLEPANVGHHGVVGG